MSADPATIPGEAPFVSARARTATAAEPVGSGARQAGPALRKAEATRLEILTAAAHLFAEKGYYACNLRELAERVGMKSGSFYYHFKSKEEILDELLSMSVNLVSDAVRNAIAAAGPDAPFRDKLGAAMRAHITAFLTQEGSSSAIMRVWDHLPPARKRKNREQRREYAGIWYGLIAEGMNGGHIRKDMPVRLLVPFIIGAMSKSVEWHNPRHMTIDAVCSFYVDFCLGGGLLPPSRTEI